MGKAIGGLPEAAALAPGAAARREAARRSDPGAAAERSDERPLDAEVEPPFALGAWLARQRELRGIRLEELSALTRLPLRSLERLEAGAFDGQQDGFVRGFVRTVAVAIGLEPDDAVARLLAEPAVPPRRRWPDPRRVAAVAGGLGVMLLLMAAIWEWSHAPQVATRTDAAPILRQDPVRALAIEEGLLPDGPALVEEPEPLRFEPALALPESIDPAAPLGATGAATAATAAPAAAP